MPAPNGANGNDDDAAAMVETHCQMNYSGDEKAGLDKIVAALAAGTEMCLKQVGRFADILSIRFRPGADVGGRAEGQPHSWAAAAAET